MRFSKIKIILSLLVSLCFCSCHHDDDIRITFIGNSCIERWDLNRYFPNIITVNHGVTNSGIENVERWAGTLYGQRAVILTGTTDLGEIVEHADYDIDLETAINLYVDRYIKALEDLHADYVYVISNPPKGKDGSSEAAYFNNIINTLNTRISEIVTAHGWQWVDIYHLFLCGDVLNPAYSSDGTHPNDVGYEIMTQELMKYL